MLDKGQIEQAMINLIINAIEATPAGGSIRVATRLSPRKGFIEIIVADTGEGMAEDRLNKIFDPFFTTKENGTGLGLAITHGIIEQHGGAISASSGISKGSTFTITLPAEEADRHAP
jgi:signal transduction histidine kinase